MQERKRHQLADTAQQIVGGFLLSGPFVVTEEVWMLARNMTVFHSLVLVVAVMAPDLFLADLSERARLFVTFQAIGVAAIFSVVGAVTTDSLF